MRSESLLMLKVGIVTGACIVAVTVVSCGPDATHEAQFTVTDGLHKAQLDKCYWDAKQKPEGQQWPYFCECWTRTNAQFHVDAGVCER